MKKRFLTILLLTALLCTLLPQTALATVKEYDIDGAYLLSGLPQDGMLGLIFNCGEGFSNVMGDTFTDGNAAVCELSPSQADATMQIVPDGAAIIRFVKNDDGACGKDLQWSFDKTAGTLTITGTGEMYDFQNGVFAPWHSFCDEILSVRLPDGLTGIGSLAFAECSNLKSIVIPEGVSRIGHSAFYYCTGLQKVTLPTSLKTIEAYAFANCWKLTDCSLPEGLEHIGVYAFQSCAITQTILPDTITGIDEGAFSSCEKLKTVLISDGVTEIPDEAFAYCKALTDVTLPSSVTSIGDSAFSFCRTLTKITLPANLTTLGACAFAECNKLQSIAIPQGVTQISSALFEYCYDLKDVTLPAGVTVIGQDAFFCSGIESITLPASVAEIGDYAFCGCEKLLHIHCLGDLPKISDSALNYCLEITTFCYLPDAEGWEFCAYPAQPFSVVETVPATCTGKGASAYVCSCGETYPAGETEALGHDFADGVCTRCGAEDPNREPPVPVDPCDGYTDIDTESWYHDAADFVIARGIMGSTRTDALTFEPTAACTRSMIVSTLYRLDGSSDVIFEDRFPDVPEKQWYSDAVIWAYKNGIVAGYDNGKFGPNDQITREQMAVILKGYADFKGIDTSGRADLSTFPDGSKATWSKDAVGWAVAAGLISGKLSGEQTLLDPQGSAARAEVASILMRFIISGR